MTSTMASTLTLAKEAAVSVRRAFRAFVALDHWSSRMMEVKVTSTGLTFSSPVAVSEALVCGVSLSDHKNTRWCPADS